MSTRSFVFTNHKGGVGKSTSATNTAYSICSIFESVKGQGQVNNSRVLLIDTDSQGHASLVTTGRNDYGEHDNLYSVIKTMALSERTRIAIQWHIARCATVLCYSFTINHFQMQCGEYTPCRLRRGFVDGDVLR